jgi:transposase
LPILNFPLFHGPDTPSPAELESIVGDSYSGVLSCNDFTTYNGDPLKAQYKCQAYLLCNFKKVIKIPRLNYQAIGIQFIDLIDEGFKNYALFQQTQNLDEFSTWASLFQPKVESSIHSEHLQTRFIVYFQ